MRVWNLVSSVLVVVLATACSGGGAPTEVKGEAGAEMKKPSDGTLKPVVAAAPAAPDFSSSIAIEPRYAQDTGKLEVVLHIKPGFHAYAPGEEIGKPVELKIDEKNGWKMEGAPVIPAGVKKDLGSLGTSQILEGDVTLAAVVKGGKELLQGTVTTQVCTDKACDRPKTHPFAVPVL